MIDDQPAPVTTDAIPNYCEAVSPLYREAALRALREVHELSAALHDTFAAETLNGTALVTLGNALDDAVGRVGKAVAGWGATISCKGAA